MTKQRQVWHVELELFNARNFRVEAAIWPKVSDGNIPARGRANPAYGRQARIIDKKCEHRIGRGVRRSEFPFRIQHLRITADVR